MTYQIIKKTVAKVVLKFSSSKDPRLLGEMTIFKLRDRSHRR